MKNKKILLLSTSTLILPLSISPIVSCSHTEEPYMRCSNLELGIFFDNRGTLWGYEGPNCQGIPEDQKVIKIPEYVEVTGPKSSPIYGKKIRITKLDKGNAPSDNFHYRKGIWRWGTENDQIIKLNEVILPNSIEEISHSTFYGSSLSKINWPNNLKLIISNAFKATQLKEIIFPKSLEDIYESAFAEIKTLKSVNFKNCKKLESIGYLAFADCDNLEGEINLSNSKYLEYIDERAFRNTKINKVILPKNTFYVKEGLDYDTFPKGCIVVGGKPVTSEKMYEIRHNYNI